MLKTIKRIFICIFLIYFINAYIIPICDGLEESYNLYKVSSKQYIEYVPIEYENIMTAIMRDEQPYTDEIAAKMDLQVYNMLSPRTKYGYDVNNPPDLSNKKIYIANEYVDKDDPHKVYIDIFIVGKTTNNHEYVFNGYKLYADEIVANVDGSNWKLVEYTDMEAKSFGWYKNDFSYWDWW